ncbi:MAG: dihydrolipoyl dehydrogenase [Planctomycetota bacterium]
MDKRADVAVVGAGPGGYVAAIRLAQLKKRVVVIDRAVLGGVCLNWGCIPSKALIHTASLVEEIRTGAEVGIHVDNLRVDMKQVQAWKQAIVNRLTGGVQQLLKHHRVDVVMGQAMLTGPNSIAVTTKEGKVTVNADHILLATGARPINIPGFEVDGKRVLNSREALELDELPKHLVVIGGGIIGLEIGTFYRKLGSQVTVVELTPNLLPGTDPDLVKVVQRNLKKRGVAVHLEAKAEKLELRAQDIELTIAPKSGERVRLACDRVLVAIGMRPNSENLGLDQAGVQTDARGFVKVDRQLRTSARSVFAIGDLIGAPLLAHKASKEGLVAAAVIAGANDSLDVRALPAAIFTDPEIATVGMSEAEAKQKGLAVKIGTFPFSASGRALTTGHSDGMVKLLADAATDQILGVGIVGPGASDLIAEASLAIEMGATSEDLALTVHAHPTLPEAVMEAAESVHGLAIHAIQK